MKKTILFNTILFLFAFQSELQARNIDYNNPVGKPLFGISFNNSWSSFTGSNLPQKYFYKPSLGSHLRCEYYIKPYLGFGIAAGIQQRGAGIKTPDLDQSLGNPDSTNRHRIRINTIDVPLYLIIKSPKDLFKGVKPSLQIGINWNRNFKTTDIFYSVEDGFHNRTNATNDYYRNAQPSLHAALGFDINAGTNLFQLQFIYNKGSNNVYNSVAFGNSVAKSSLFGVQLSILY